MTRRRTTLLTGCTALALALGATACGGGGPVSAGGGDKALSGQTVSVAGVWSGSEQKNFQKVLDAFTAKTGAKTQFTSTGDNVSTVVGSKIEGGNAPKSREMYFATYQAIAKDEQRPGLYRDYDPDCDLWVVSETQSMPIRYALSNNIGLGGHNGAVIFKRYDGD